MDKMMQWSGGENAWELARSRLDMAFELGWVQRSQSMWDRRKRKGINIDDAMRLRSTGSVLGLAQVVVLRSVGIRHGVYLASNLTRLDVKSIEEESGSTDEERGSSEGMMSASSTVTGGICTPLKRKLSERTSATDPDMSMSEVTVEVDDDSVREVPEAVEGNFSSLLQREECITRVDIGKVEAMKLVLESTQAMKIGRVLDFETFSTAVKTFLYIVDALLIDLHKAHHFISSDIVTNLRKIARAVEYTNTTCAEDMVLNEIQMGVKWRNSGREALLWLKRSLVFIYTACKYVVERPDLELVRNAKDAYKETLAPCHGFRSHAVKFMMNGIPGQQTFFLRLGHDERQVVEDLKLWLTVLHPVLEHLTTFCRNNKLEKIGKLKTF